MLTESSTSSEGKSNEAVGLASVQGSRVAPLWPSGEKPDGCDGCVYAKRRIHGAKYQFVGGHGPANARLAIIAEAPGGHETSKTCGPQCSHPLGEPLVGPTGDIVSQAGCGRDAAFRTNIRKCVPPDIETESDRTSSIAHCVRAYLVPEVQAFGSEWRHIHCLGAEAFEAWTGIPKIAKYHQSVLTRAEVEAVRAAMSDPEPETTSLIADVDEEEEDDDDGSD